MRYCKLLNDYTVSSLVCLKGSGYSGKQYKVDDTEMTVTENFEEELEKCSAILPLFSDKEDAKLEEREFVFFEKNVNEIIIENLKKAIEQQKKVIICDKYLRNRKEWIPEKLQIHIYRETIEKSKLSLKQFHNIKTPVIFIASAFEGLDKTKILLSIYNELLSREYKILAFGTRQDCELFGIHSYPEFMYDEKLDDNQKILSFNEYAKRMEMEYTPDLIMIGIPGGTAPFSAKAPLDFGTTLYKMIRAVVPDYFILSLPYANYNDMDYQYWEKYFENSFGITVDSFNISPKSILQQMVERNNSAKYLTIDREEVDLEIKNKEKIFCYLNADSVKKETDRLIQQLKEYGKVELF